MKKVFENKILNVLNTDLFDNRFLFDVFLNMKNNKVEIIYISELLEEKKKIHILEKVKEKPAMYSNVYSPEDELEIFKNLFNDAIKNNKKIHIVWVTLDEEIKILEDYYSILDYMREDINCFDPNFSEPLVTVSVKIENLMWKWSDYKALKDKIFFNPPIRESWQVKAMFKWINRWVIAWIYISEFTEQIERFLETCIKEEKILSITLSKVLYYNFINIWFKWEKKELIINY